MTTNSYPSAGVIPSVNDIVAGLAVLAVYVDRFGTIAEGQEPSLLLQVTTDLLIPLLASVWLLAVPTWMLYKRVENR